MDVWILAILLRENLQTYQVGVKYNHQNKIERILTRRLYKLPAKSVLFVKAIQGNGVALVSVTKSLLKMAEVLAHNSSSVAQELAQSIYIALWEEYSQQYYQQDVGLAK